MTYEISENNCPNKIELLLSRVTYLTSCRSQLFPLDSFNKASPLQEILRDLQSTRNTLPKLPLGKVLKNSPCRVLWNYDAPILITQSVSITFVEVKLRTSPYSISAP